MATFNELNSVTNVVRNIARQQERIAAGMERGLKKAGLTLQRASMLLVPVEFGVLKASAFTRAVGTGYKTVVKVGYTARYAIYVHELVDMKLKREPRVPNPPHKGNYWDPAGRGQAKFLEAPARSMKAQLRKIIIEEAYIK